MKAAAMWQEAVDTVLAEFSDLPDTAQVTRIVLRLLIAALLGGVLGWEREVHGKAAGVRTHMLVAMGAALFVLVPQQAGARTDDLSRIIQGLVAGIGFLGAGAIVKDHAERNVQGLTTAAGIWMTAAIGVAVGLGREATAFLSTLLALLVLAVVPHVARGLSATTQDAAARAGEGKGKGKDDGSDKANGLEEDPRPVGRPAADEENRP